MKYYLHDTNAFQDEKITELFIKFGYEGLGLFYTVLEKLALQEKPVKTDVLKKQLFIGKKLNKIWSFMEEIGIISSNNGETFNKQLLKFSEKYQIKKEKNAKRISEWREKQADSENVTCYKSVRNTPKVKESKVKESNYKTSLLSDLKKSDFDDSEYFEITIAFYELFKKNLIEAGGSTVQLENSKGKWIDSIRLLIEKDKQSKESIREVFAFLQKDPFWKKNILSTETLRKQFNKLLMSSKNETNRRSNKQQPATTDEELAAIVANVFIQK